MSKSEAPNHKEKIDPSLIPSFFPHVPKVTQENKETEADKKANTEQKP